MLKIDHHPAYFLQEDEVVAMQPVKRRRKALGNWVESEDDDPMDEDYAHVSEGSDEENARRAGLRSSSRVQEDGPSRVTRASSAMKTEGVEAEADVMVSFCYTVPYRPTRCSGTTKRAAEMAEGYSPSWSSSSRRPGTI